MLIHFFSGVGPGSIYSIHFSSRDIKKDFIMVLQAMNQINWGESYQHKLLFEA